MLADRTSRLFVILAAFFASNALMTGFIGVKIFTLEDTLGLAPFNWELFGQSGSLNFMLSWPKEQAHSLKARAAA